MKLPAHSIQEKHSRYFTPAPVLNRTTRSSVSLVLSQSSFLTPANRPRLPVRRTNPQRANLASCGNQLIIGNSNSRPPRLTQASIIKKSPIARGTRRPEPPSRRWKFSAKRFPSSNARNRRATSGWTVTILGRSKSHPSHLFHLVNAFTFNKSRATAGRVDDYVGKFPIKLFR